MVDNKYLLAMMIAKRAKELKKGAKPLVESKYKQPVKIALEEIKAGKVYLKKEEEPLQAEQIFNEDEGSTKAEDISDEVEKPAKIEEIFNNDQESGKSKD